MIEFKFKLFCCMGLFKYLLNSELLTSILLLQFFSIYLFIFYHISAAAI